MNATNMEVMLGWTSTPDAVWLETGD